MHITSAPGMLICGPTPLHVNIHSANSLYSVSALSSFASDLSGSDAVLLPFLLVVDTELCSCGSQIIVKVAIQGERPRMDADCPDGLKRLIQKCWHQDPHQRPSCAEIVRLTDIMMHQDMRRAR